MKAKVDVLLVDDHYIVRAGIRDLLNMADDMCVEGEAGTGEEALTQIRRRTWSLVLLDFKHSALNNAA